MKIKLLILTAFLTIFAFSTFAQNGGKAEPLRLSFAKGKTSTVFSGSLKAGETYETVFGAKEGQKVKIKIISTSPKGKFHYFSLLGDGFDFATEQDVNWSYEFTVPQTGDYLMNINFNPTSKVTAGKFSLTLSITNQ